MNAYIYNAALYCDDCGQALIREHLRRDCANTGDSGGFPQGPYSDGGGESDTPQHCDACNVFLENPLTMDNWAERRAALNQAISSFPDTFHITSFSGLFRISPTASYFSDVLGIQLYLERLVDGDWLEFAKDSPEALRRLLRK